MPVRMHDDEVEVDEALVRGLVAAQMPDLADRPLTMVEPWGTDNAVWRLGDELVVRLPRIGWAVGQIEREATWLPRLGPHLPVAVPEPVAVGEPGNGYPYPWAVHRWIPGEAATLDRISDPVGFALDLAEVLRTLQAVPTHGAPPAQNPGPTAARLRQLDPPSDRRRESPDRHRGSHGRMGGGAGGAPYGGPPVWVQGDLEGNCLLREGRLCGIVDWGSACTGDPAVDVQVVWSPLFTDESRRAFLAALDVDDATLARSRGAAIHQHAPHFPTTSTPIH